MLSFPFLYIPSMDVWQFLAYLPMAFVYDLGSLYRSVFRNPAVIMNGLPWPKLFSSEQVKMDWKNPGRLFWFSFCSLLLLFVFLHPLWRSFLFQWTIPLIRYPCSAPMLNVLFHSFLSMLGVRSRRICITFYQPLTMAWSYQGFGHSVFTPVLWNAPMKVDFQKFMVLMYNLLQWYFS